MPKRQLSPRPGSAPYPPPDANNTLEDRQEQARSLQRLLEVGRTRQEIMKVVCDVERDSTLPGYDKRWGLPISRPHTTVWYRQQPQRPPCAVPFPTEAWGDARFRFSIAFKNKQVLVAEPKQDCVLALRSHSVDVRDFVRRYFYELGSGWCCNCDGVVEVDPAVACHYIFRPNFDHVFPGADGDRESIEAIVERQLSVLSGDSDSRKEWLAAIFKGSHMSTYLSQVRVEAFNRAVTRREGDAGLDQYMDKKPLFPRELGDSAYAGAALFSQTMFAAQAANAPSLARILQWVGPQPRDVSVEDAANCLHHVWADPTPSVAYMPVPNPSFAYEDIVYAGMGARVDAWWEGLEQSPAAVEVAGAAVTATWPTQGAGADSSAAAIAVGPPLRLRYVAHRLLPTDGWSYERGMPASMRPSLQLHTGQDYHYRETRRAGLLGYPAVEAYPPLWLARCAYAAATIARALPASLQAELLTVRAEILAALDKEFPISDLPAWAEQPMDDYVLLFALMPRFYDLPEAWGRLYTPISVYTDYRSDEDESA